MRSASSLAAVVDFHDELIGEGFVTLRDDLDARLLRDAGKIGKRHGGKGREVDFFGFKRRSGARPVGQNAIDDLIELRLVLAPVIGIAGQAVIFAGLIFRKTKGPVPTGFVLAGLVAISLPS